ncbi:MAG: hypothetical protein II840_14005 [Kiritimatiellae bacterium]|nr:hypothetical protein [Kiritimatiellia bacterium]
MKSALCILLIVVLTPFLSSAQAVDDHVKATGMAQTYRGAVNEALVSALEQHDGTIVSATEIRKVHGEDSSLSIRENGALSDSAKIETNDSISKEMQKWAKGKILGYDVLSDTFDPVTKKYRVELSVRFPGRYVVGRDPNALRRMAVANFGVRGQTFKWYGQPVDTVEWSAALGNQLNVVLTQTRKFTMLDRAFDREVNSELARLGAANAAPSDAIRLNQKLGTDYLVVGEVSFSDVVAPGVNPITGQALPQQPAMFAEVNYRVLLAPTGQLKWADTVKLDASQFAASDVRSFISMTAEAAASAICDGLMADILPFEVAAIKSGFLVIGEGGKQLSVGERFTVCALGDEVTDTRTGEVLDVMEIPVATAEISSVQSKLSYAKVIEGDLSQIKVGARLRRISVPAPAQQIPITTTIQSNGSGGVVTPF